MLAVGGLAFLLLPSHTATDDFAPTDPAPEASQRPPAITGDAFQESVEQAIDDIRLQGTAYETTEPHGTLKQVTEETIKSAQQCSTQEARDAIDSGSWTDNAVAQAFLSDSLTPPATFRLLRWISPVEAYRHGLSETVHAVTQLIRTDVSAAPNLTSDRQTRSGIATTLQARPVISWITTSISELRATRDHSQGSGDSESSDETPVSPDSKAGSGEK